MYPDFYILSPISTADTRGTIKLWELGHEMLSKSLDSWLDLIGTATGAKLRLELLAAGGKDVSSPKHGKHDPENDPHVGGNTWAGGTGGRDTAGLGGKGGPYRLVGSCDWQDYGRGIWWLRSNKRAKASERERDKEIERQRARAEERESERAGKIARARSHVHTN